MYVCKFEKVLDGGQELSKWSEAMDMTKWVKYLASDVIGDLTFSRNWNTLESKENKNIPAVIAQGLAGLNLVCP